MDPLSAIASAIAVVQLADKVISLCKSYITGVHDAPVDLRKILIEVSSMKCVLEVIELLGHAKDGTSSPFLETLGGPLNECNEALKSLESMLSPQFESPSEGRRQKIVLSLVRLAWPLKKEKAQRLLDEIARHKSTISLSLTTEAV